MFVNEFEGFLMLKVIDYWHATDPMKQSVVDIMIQKLLFECALCCVVFFMGMPVYSHRLFVLYYQYVATSIGCCE
jgi:hypothetical protein